MTSTATPTSLDSFAAHVEELAKRQEDFVSDTRKVGYFVEEANDEDGNAIEGRVQGRTTLTIDDVVDGNGDMREFEVNDHAHRQIAARLEIPFKFYERLRETHPDLLQHDVQELLIREPQRRMVRTLDGNARAFLSNKYRRLDNYELLRFAIVPALGETECTIQATHLTDLRMYVKVLFPQLEDHVKNVGDIVQAGLLITNSEVGAGALNVEPLAFRLICLNGMVVPVGDFAEWGIRRQHVGRQVDDTNGDVFSERTLALDDAAFYSKVKDVVANAADGIKFAAIVDKMRDLADVKVEGDPVEAVERLANRYNVTQGEQASIMEHLIEGADLSMWGYVNAVTRTAQDAGSYDRQVDLERIGGTMLASTRKQIREFAVAA